MSAARRKLFDQYPEAEFLFADGLDDAIVGVEVSKYRLVYSVPAVIKILKSRDGMTQAEAYEFFEFNILGAQMGEKTPIFLQEL